MERYKWFRIKTPTDYSSTVDNLCGCRFRSDLGFGFRIEDKGDSFSEFVFTQEVSVFEEYVDPFGEQVEYEIKRYIDICFSLVVDEEGLFFLRVVNPPRSIKPLKDAVAYVLGYGFFIDQVQLDVVGFLNTLKQQVGDIGCQVSRIKATGLSVGRKSTASVIVSSAVNALDDFESSFSKSRYKIEKIKFSILLGSVRQEFEVSSTGSLVVSHELSDSIVSAVHSSFRLDPGCL